MIVHRAVDGRTSAALSCHIMSLRKHHQFLGDHHHLTMLQLCDARFMPLINTASVHTHRQISKLVKSAAWSVPSYLLILHSTGSTLHWVTQTRWQVMVKTCPSRLHTFTESEVRKRWKDHRPTWVWTPMLWSPWYLPDPLQRTNLQGPVPVNEKWTSSVTYPRTSHQRWKLRKS